LPSATRSPQACRAAASSPCEAAHGLSARSRRPDGDADFQTPTVQERRSRARSRQAPASASSQQLDHGWARSPSGQVHHERGGSRPVASGSRGQHASLVNLGTSTPGNTANQSAALMHQFDGPFVGKARSTGASAQSESRHRLDRQQRRARGRPLGPLPWTASR
jgi:hypothetical protein